MKNQVAKLPQILVIVLFLGSSLLVWTSLLDVSFLPRISFLFVMLLGIVGYLFYSKGYLPQMNVISIMYALLVVISILASLNALNQKESFFGILKLASGILTYFLLFNLIGNTTEIKERLLSNLSILFLGVIVINNFVIVWQIFEKGSFIFRENELKTFAGLMSNKNLGAEFYATLIPFFAFYEARSIKGNFLKWGLPMFIILFSVLMQARGAFLASVIGCILSIGFQWQNQISKFKFKLSLVIALALIGISILCINFLSGNSVFKLFTEIINPHVGTGNTRLKIWQIGFNQIQEHPLLGLGLENWKIDFPKYGFKQNASKFSAYPLNDFIAMGTETGIFGLVLYLGLFLFTIYKFTAIKVENRPGLEKAAFCAIVIFGVVSFFNFPKDRVELILIFNFSLAVLNKFQISKNRWNESVTIVFSMLILFGFFVAIQRMKSEYYLTKALTYRQQNRWGMVISNINKAENPFYCLDISTTPILWYRGIAYYMQGKTDKACLDFEIAYNQHPNHTQVISNQANMLEFKAKHAEAEMLYKRLIKMAPKFREPYENFAILLYNQKRFQEASNLLAPLKIKAKNYRFWMINFNVNMAYWFSLNRDLMQFKLEGKTTKVKEIEMNLVAMKPNFEKVLETHASNLINQGKFEDAIKVAENFPENQSLIKLKILKSARMAIQGN